MKNVSSASLKPIARAVNVLDVAEQAFQVAVSELGKQADDPAVSDLLKVLIEAGIEGGGEDPLKLAHAAIDEAVLITGGRIWPLLAS